MVYTPSGRGNPAASLRQVAAHFSAHLMIYTATRAQIWHEMQRQPAGRSGHAIFRLKIDSSGTVYRYRGVHVFSVSVALSWLDDAIGLVGADGRPWLPTWGQFSASMPETLGAGTGLVVSVVLDAPAVAWAPSPVRDAKRVASMSETRATWPGQIDAIRTEWEPRRKTVRRAGYLAAADALQGALDFDRLRGA